jgi:predicted Rossmann fold flavoprotein
MAIMSELAFDAVVIGAGAAGLMASIFAAERGRKVLLLEKGRKAGVKILMSGGTRCNITHHCDNRGIAEAFGVNGRFLMSPLAGFSPQEVVEFFHGEGVLTKVEDTGKIFPVSDRALDVLNALLKRLERSGAKLALGEPALDVASLPTGGFQVQTALRTITAQHLLVTTGGLSYPGCGTTGDGYGFARKFGHTILPTKPSLVPLTTLPAWVPELKGITIPDVSLKLTDGGPKALSTRRGALLFAHFGLTGPAPMDISRAVSGHPSPKSLTLEVDYLPQMTEAKFDEVLQAEAAANAKKQLASVLAEHVSRRVCDQILRLAAMPEQRTAAALSKVDRKKLVALVKRMPIPLRGTLGYEKAEVTSGGVSLDEVDSKTMQSKKQPGLFFAGEVLDLDGWIGGYNFQSAWSTGRQAARYL